MFRFKARNQSNTMEEIKAFTINLLRKTRPNLSENLLRIVAEDLISRAGVEVGYTTEESEEELVPFQYSPTNISRPEVPKRNFSMPVRIKNGSDIRSSRISLTGKENKQQCDTQSNNRSAVSKLSKCEDRPLSMEKAMTPQIDEAKPNRKRSYKYNTPSLPSSNTSLTSIPSRKSQVNASGTTRRSKEISKTSTVGGKIMQADVLQGAPEMKKKRISTEVPHNDNCSNSPHIANVFERLYSMRKHKCSHKANTEEITKNNVTQNRSKLSRCKVNTSLNNSVVDSIQKTLSEFSI